VSAHRRHRRGQSRRPPSSPARRPDVLIPVFVGIAPPLSPTTLRQVERLEGCLLCGKPPLFLDVWRPVGATQRRLMGPSDRPRSVAYKLCTLCVKLPDVMQRAEARVLADIEEAAREMPLN
jgi:hypothetical protein